MVSIELPTSSQMSDNCREIVVLQEQAERVMSGSEETLGDRGKYADTSTFREIEVAGSSIETRSFSDSESSSASNEIEEIIEDLKRYNDCFLDLAPTLENPAKESDPDENACNLSEETQILAQARPFVADIKYRYPSIDEEFARRLGEANWQRRERLRERLAAALPEIIELENKAFDEQGTDLSGYLEEAVNISGLSETNKSSYSGPSSWAISSSGPQAQMKSVFRRAPASMTSLATSIEDGDLGKARRRIPKLPVDHEWGSVFRCTVCGDTLRNVDSPAEWKCVVFSLIYALS
jgi:hypothetical protein